MPDILADENTPGFLILLLQESNIKVTWIPKTEYRGYSDKQLVELANKGEMTILTHDRDYTELPLRKLIKTGVIHLKLRVTDTNVHIVADQITRMLSKARRAIVTISENYVSIEKLI